MKQDKAFYEALSTLNKSKRIMSSVVESMINEPLSKNIRQAQKNMLLYQIKAADEFMNSILQNVMKPK